jgi:hypothetical protein
MRESHQILVSKAFPAGDALRRTHARTQCSPIVWLNLICLDAPIVAVTWQWLFAASFQISLTASSRAALFLTAWLIYLVDRLADAWSLNEYEPRSLRQKFCQRHLSAWLAAIAVLTLADLWIISNQLEQAIIRIGIAIGAISLLYLGINYWLGKLWRFLPMKEICIGCLFASGTLAALLPRVGLTIAFVAASVLFAAICSLNCISIAVWERDLDRAQYKNSIATCLPGIRFSVRPLAIALAILAIAIGFITNAPARPFFCVATSAALLGMLDLLGERIPPDERTALADLVLLTPLLFFTATLLG